jgi:large subunit ribosomal protein L21
MYAIVEISGKQFRVQKDMQLRVPRQELEPGKKIGFDRVLLIEDDKGNTTIGDPVVKNTQVAATVIEHGRDKKVIVFKKKRRKGYKKKQGHRQGYSVIEINTIGAPTVKKPATAAKPAATPAAAKEKTTPTAKKEVKTTQKTAAKKTTPATAKPKTSAAKATTVKKIEKPAAKTTKTAAKAAPKKADSTAAAKKPVAKKETKEK